MATSSLPSRLAARCAVGVLAALGCTTTTYDATDPKVAILTPISWAGADIVLTSPDFAGRDTLPLVVAGSDTLVARFSAPDTVRAVAPLREGTFELWVGLRGRTPVPVGEVKISGAYAGLYKAPLVGGYPIPWPGGGRPSFLIATVGGLALVDPSLRAVERIAGDSLFHQDCFNGPGRTTSALVTIAARTTGCAGFAVDPRTPAAVRDSGPVCWYCRFSAQLGPGRWLTFWHHGLGSYLRNDSGGWTILFPRIEEPMDVIISPHGDRAVPLASGVGNGVPVFGPLSADPVYTIPQHQVWAAAFTGDGDTLFVVGLNAAQSSYLYRLRAADGSVIDSAPVWAGDDGVVLDPRGRWIYLPGFSDGWTTVLQVLDRATMRVVTTLVSEDVADPGNLYAILSPAENRLYVINSCAWCTTGVYMPVSSFNLQP